MCVAGSGGEWDSVSGHIFSSGRRVISLDPVEEDKLEVISNQTVVTFLEFLAVMEDQCHGDRRRRVEFRCFAISS